MKKLIFNCYFIFIFFLFQNLLAAEFKGDFNQGSFILGKAEPNSKIVVDNKKIRITKEGYFVFGLSRDRKKNICGFVQRLGDFSQGQLQRWTEHSTLIFENLKTVEISKNIFNFI